MIVYNHGLKEIFITTDYQSSPNGGPAVWIQSICIEPGGGIDLDIIGLKPELPIQFIGDGNEFR